MAGHPAVLRWISDFSCAVVELLDVGDVAEAGAHIEDNHPERERPPPVLAGASCHRQAHPDRTLDHRLDAANVCR